MGFNCETKCPIPQLMPENLEAWDIIRKFGSIIFNGESISASAIEQSMTWYGIRQEQKSVLAQKIASFYSTIRHKNYERMEEKAKKGR
jgi:hypothetical protein